MRLSIRISSSYGIIWLACITLIVEVPFDPLAKLEVILIFGFYELVDLNGFLDKYRFIFFGDQLLIGDAGSAVVVENVEFDLPQLVA